MNIDPIQSAILGALLVIAGLLVTVIILIVPVNGFVKNLQSKITSDWINNIKKKSKNPPASQKHENREN
jgi:hypothetical protein